MPYMFLERKKMDDSDAKKKMWDEEIKHNEQLSYF